MLHFQPASLDRPIEKLSAAQKLHADTTTSLVPEPDPEHDLFAHIDSPRVVNAPMTECVKPGVSRCFYNKLLSVRPLVALIELSVLGMAQALAQEG